ncbi:p-hydroxybenzoic acid efflux pump subunit AaeA [Rhizobium sp. CECT 9324]|nr:p-hydroxybenzoic acid efflux pump subunit AaeA [Rhizobium sp. CECT 9324]
MKSEGDDTVVQERSDQPEVAPPPANPLRRIALIVVCLALALFILSVFMERRTPSTSQAHVQAYVVGIAAEVTGRIVEVGISDNARVEAGQLLFRIDPQRYELAVSEAEAALASAGQSIGASTATVDSAQAKLVQIRADRDNLRDQYARASELVKRGVYSRARFDAAKSAYDQAEASVSAAEAELAKAKELLGPSGDDNPQLRAALAGLEKARLDLVRTTVRAPSSGVVTNLQLSIGKVVSVGQPAMTFIDAGTIWIAAAFKENSLERVAAGNRAEILFDALPGRVFPATVESVGFGISQGNTDPNTGLPMIRNDSGWVREAQRFPVRLIMDETQRPERGIRYGSQTTVVIFTGDNPFTNAWGSLWIRIMSVLSYVN